MGGNMFIKKNEKVKKKKSFFFEEQKKEKKALFFFSSLLSNTEKTTYIYLKKISFFILRFSKFMRNEQAWKIQSAFNNLHINLLQLKKVRGKKNYISCLKNSIEKYSNFPFSLYFTRKGKVKQRPYILSAKHVVQRISVCLRLKKKPSSAIKKLFRILRKKGRQS